MRARVAALVAGLAAGLASWPDPLLAVGPQLRSTPAVPDVTSRTPGIPAPQTWDTFTADVSIRRAMVRKDGSAGPVAPAVKYRWVRRLDEGGWKTTLTVVSVEPATIQTANGPRSVPFSSPVSRIEIGDPRTPARVYGPDGRLVFMLPTQPRPADADGAAGGAPAPTPAGAVGAAARAAALPRSAPDLAGMPPELFDAAIGATKSRDWVEQLLPTAGGREIRRAALTRQMGAPQGTVRGLHRFVSTDGEATTEVLSDATWMTPLEVNVVRRGVLTSHSTISYVEDPGAGLVRRRMKTEQLVSAESGDRAVVDVEFSNIRLDRSGVR